MGVTNYERWGAATGYVVIVLGIAGAAFERGGPPANAPAAEAIRFFSTYRRELIAQSLMFVLSAGAYLWFFGSVRNVLQKAEGGTGRLSSIAFGAGLVWVGVQMVFQAVQVGLAMAARGALEASIAGLVAALLWALSVTGYVPLAVALLAIAVVSLRHRAYPRWLAWLSSGVGLAHLVMFFGLVADGGPLVPGGGLTFALYGVLLVWLLAMTTTMVVGRHDTRAAASTVA